MRTLLLHFFDTKDSKQAAILQNLAKGAESNGNQVDIFAANCDALESLHLSLYEYIAVAVTSPKFIGAKSPRRLSEILASCGTVSGKKGCAVVVKSGLSSNKMVHVVMNELEKQGMVLDYFDVILSAEHSVAVGKNIG